MELPENPALREKRMLEPGFLAAKSVARAPDHLLRAIDQLGAAGWDFSAVDLPAAREALQRVVDLYPQSAAAENAKNRIAHLQLELRSQTQSQPIKLGSHKQNPGLNDGSGVTD